MNKTEAINRARAIMDEWEALGWNCPNDVSECPLKDEFRSCMNALEIKVEF